jgi:ATP phosphoribosyltransferase regulatory subunit
VGLGDASLYPGLLEAAGVDAPTRERILGELVAGDFVGLERALDSLELAPGQRSLLLGVARTRGGPEVLEGQSGALDQALEGLRAVHALLPAHAAQRIIFDLGLVRNLGYYTGAVFQIYDPAHGVPIGQGGRYDQLLARFGRPLPAVGFALGVERVHIALAGEERGLGTWSPE